MTRTKGPIRARWVPDGQRGLIEESMGSLQIPQEFLQVCVFLGTPQTFKLGDQARLGVQKEYVDLESK